MSNPSPPIKLDGSRPELESRDDLKSARAEELIDARQQVRDVRHKTAALYNREPSYTRENANSEYLDALQDLIIELETIYNRIGICEEYWTEEGDPLAVLTRPPLKKSDVMEPRPAAYNNGDGGYPQLRNPEVLDGERLEVLWHLGDLFTYDTASVQYRVVLKPVTSSRDTRVHQDSMVISRSVLDRALRWTFEFWEKAGLSIDKKEDTHGVVGGGDRYGDD